MTERWIALLTLGSFCVLSSYCYGTQAPKVRYATHKSEPVNIVASQDKCDQTDWLCLIALAEEQHPTKHKRRKS